MIRRAFKLFASTYLGVGLGPASSIMYTEMASNPPAGSSMSILTAQQHHIHYGAVKRAYRGWHGYRRIIRRGMLRWKSFCITPTADFPGVVYAAPGAARVGEVEVVCHGRGAEALSCRIARGGKVRCRGRHVSDFEKRGEKINLRAVEISPGRRRAQNRLRLTAT